MKDEEYEGPASQDRGDEERLSEDLASRLAFLELDETDAERLRALGTVFESYAETFVEAFYEHLFAFPETAAFLQDPARVERLKKHQRRHFASLLNARWDEDFVRERRRVGQTHAEVGLDPRLFLGAYNQYVQHSFRHFVRQRAIQPGEHLERILSLLKAIFLDVGLTLDAYFHESTEKLRRALEMFWEANTELRQFAQLTSHDLKTPLATMANLCEEVLDEFGEQIPKEARELIESARRKAFHMGEMIEALLGSMIAPVSMETNESVPSEEVISEALERIAPLVKSKKIEIVTAENLPTVWGNEVRLREAFFNLLSNAAKFLDKQPGRIEIGFELTDAFCVFSISDNGPGIPLNELESIFVPFRRLPEHSEHPGSGLGLYFAKMLIERQGGRVWVESVPGDGSRFFVQVPLRPLPINER